MWLPYGSDMAHIGLPDGSHMGLIVVVVVVVVIVLIVVVIVVIIEVL